jgi:hypothetical protein
VLKRIAAIASVLIAAGALTAGSVTAANAATTPSIHWRAETHLSANPDITCKGEIGVFENYYGTDGHHGNGQYWYSRVGSPHQLLANSAKTGYCPVVSTISNTIDIAIYGTDNCLTAEADGRVDATKCDTSNDNQAIYLFPAAGYEGAVVYNANFALSAIGNENDCIYQDGRDSPVALKNCSPTNTGDLWILTTS